MVCTSSITNLLHSPGRSKGLSSFDLHSVARVERGLVEGPAALSCIGGVLPCECPGGFVPLMSFRLSHLKNKRNFLDVTSSHLNGNIF